MKKKLLVTDIDNTLFDWFAMWHNSFNVMINTAAEISKVPRTELLIAAKKIHQKYGTAEYSFLLEELEPLKRKFGSRENLRCALEPAIRVYREARQANMVLYPGVLETMRKIRQGGIRIFAFSESKTYYSSYRIYSLGLDGIIEKVYCPEDHVLPDDKSKTEMLKVTECEILHGDFKKPNPEILLKIAMDAGVKAAEVLYVGDSKSKDIKMAIDAGIDYVWFEHGTSHLNYRKEDYDLLREVTHWTEAEVEAERLLNEDSKSMKIPESKIIHHYNEILNHI